MTKTLYILIGLKGSGKTTIGTLVAQRTDIVFLPRRANLAGAGAGRGWLNRGLETTIDEMFFHTRDKLIKMRAWSRRTVSPVSTARWPGVRSS